MSENALGKMDQLWIRACKAKDPVTRLYSVHRRFYGLRNYRPDEQTPWILLLLADLADRHFPVKMADIIPEVGPAADFKYEGIDFNGRMLRALMYHIRFKDVRGIKGFTPPAWARRSRCAEAA